MARILIVGGSLGGLLAASLLVRAGHHVTLLEKSPASLDGRGAGIVTHPPLIEALNRAGGRTDASLGVPVASRRVLDRDGRVEASCAMPQILTSWSRLYQLLGELIPPSVVHLGTEVVTVTQTSSQVVATCLDGRWHEGDLLIASDGLRSSVRAQYASDVHPQYAGYVAWRGVCDEASLSEETLSTLFGFFGFCLPPGEQILGYPVAGPDNCTVAGGRRYNFVWYRPAQDGEALDRLMTDDQGNHYPTGIPPHRVTRENVAQMRRDARRLLAPQFVEVLERTAQPFLQPIFDVSSDRIAFERVALMGDASFVARPHVGMGVTKAAEDALALCECIGSFGATATALKHYEQQRLAVGQAVVQRGRDLGAYMQSHGNDARLPPGSVTRDAHQVLLDTAIDFRTQPSVASAYST